MTRKLCLVASLMLLCGGALHAEREFEFGEGLRQLKYYDLAIEHFEKLKNDAKASRDDRNKAILGLGSIYEDQALNEADKEKKADLINKASVAYGEFLKNAEKGSREYDDANFRMARLKKNEGKALFDQAKLEEDKAKKKALEDKAIKLLDDAIKAFAEVVEKIEDPIIKLEDKGRKMKKSEQAEYSRLRQTRANAMLEGLWARYFKLRIVSDEKAVKKMIDEAENFQFIWDGTSLSAWGNVFIAAAHALSGKNDKANSAFQDVVDFEENEWTIPIKYQGFYIYMESLMEKKAYENAGKACEAFIENFPFHDKRLKPMAGAIQIMGGDAYTQCEDPDLKAKGLDIWQALAQTTDPGSYEAKKKIKDYFEANPDTPKSTGILYAEAISFMGEKDYARAIQSFEDAYAGANVREKRKLGINIHKYLANCHFQLEQYRSAALIFEYLAIRYKNHEDRKNWFKNAKGLYGKTFSLSKSKADKAEYGRILQIENTDPDFKPATDGKVDPNWTPATIKESDRMYLAAAEQYAKVAETSDKYPAARWKVAYLPWLHIRIQRSKNKKGFNLSRYSKELKMAQDGMAVFEEKMAAASEEQKPNWTKYQPDLDLQKAEVMQMQGKQDEAIAGFEGYLKNHAGKKLALESKVLLNLLVHYNKKKDYAKLGTLLEKLRKVEPTNKYISIFQKVVAGFELNSFYKTRTAWNELEDGDPQKAELEKKMNMHALNAANAYYGMHTAGQPLHSDPKQAAQLLEFTADALANRGEKYDSAMKIYKVILKNLGEPVEYTKKAVYFPVDDKRIRKAEAEKYKKFADLLIDDKPLHEIKQKDWGEKPVNYADALKLGYTYNRKLKKYEPGGILNKSKLAKQTIDTMNTLLPEILKRKAIIETKTKMSLILQKQGNTQEAEPILEELDKYYINEISTKRNLATIKYKNAKWEEAEKLWSQIRGSYDPPKPEWFDATYYMCSARGKQDDPKKKKSAYKTLMFTITSQGANVPERIQKLAAELAGEIKEK